MHLKVGTVKVTRERRRYDGGAMNRVAECIVGDQYGCVKMMAFDEQLDIVKEGEVITIRNAHANVVKEHLRLEVDRWAKVEKSSEKITMINLSNNASDIEYELVNVKQWAAKIVCQNNFWAYTPVLQLNIDKVTFSLSLLVSYLEFLK